MNLDTAEPAIAERPSEIALEDARFARGRTRVPRGGQPDGSTASWWVEAPARRLARLQADQARMVAIADVWRALWTSRLLVWAAGVAAVAAFGFGPARNAFHPPGVTRGFGWLGDLLAAPAARWDAAWYLVIAHYGYRPDLGSFTASRTAFFPLYPLTLSGLARLGLPAVLAGVTVSLGALALALYGLHRLTTLEHSRSAARLAVLLTALGPMAFYFSALYSESLYLALSVGVFLCARRGRWGWAATLAALAGAARSTGVVLVVPLVLLYLYGPRSDRPPDRLTRLRPRYRLRRDALWLAAVPAGLGLYMAYLGLEGGEAFSPFHAQAEWHRGFAGPYGGVWDGARAAFQGARQLFSLQRSHVYFPAAGGSPFIDAGHNLMLFAFLVGAIPLLFGVLRRMPLAYGVYVLAALALPLSYPVASQPLMSLPRFLAVLFPLNMWLADRLAAGGDRQEGRAASLAGGDRQGGRAAAHRRLPATLAARARLGAPAVVLACSAACLVFFTAEFATWHWVA